MVTRRVVDAARAYIDPTMEPRRSAPPSRVEMRADDLERFTRLSPRTSLTYALMNDIIHPITQWSNEERCYLYAEYIFQLVKEQTIKRNIESTADALNAAARSIVDGNAKEQTFIIYDADKKKIMSLRNFLITHSKVLEALPDPVMEGFRDAIGDTEHKIIHLNTKGAGTYERTLFSTNNSLENLVSSFFSFQGNEKSAFIEGLNRVIDEVISSPLENVIPLHIKRRISARIFEYLSPRIAGFGGKIVRDLGTFDKEVKEISGRALKTIVYHYRQNEDYNQNSYPIRVDRGTPRNRGYRWSPSWAHMTGLFVIDGLPVITETIFDTPSVVRDSLSLSSLERKKKAVDLMCDVLKEKGHGVGEETGMVLFLPGDRTYRHVDNFSGTGGKLLYLTANYYEPANNLIGEYKPKTRIWIAGNT